MRILSFEIPGEPVPKERPRFTRSGFTYTPKKTREYENKVLDIFMNQWKNFPEWLDTATFEIQLAFYLSIPKSTPKKNLSAMGNQYIRPTKRPDIDNLIKPILDALNKVLYKDDAQVASIKAEKFYSVDPRTTVIINIFNENYRCFDDCHDADFESKYLRDTREDS